MPPEEGRHHFRWQPNSFRSRHRSKPKAFSLGSWPTRISANYSDVLWQVDKLYVPWQTVTHVSVRAMGARWARPSNHPQRRSTTASPINLLTNNDSELTGTRLQRPMLTDWSSPLAISSYYSQHTHRPWSQPCERGRARPG